MDDEYIGLVMKPLRDRTPSPLPLVRGALTHAISELRALMKAATNDEDREAYGRATAFAARALSELD